MNYIIYVYLTEKTNNKKTDKTIYGRMIKTSNKNKKNQLIF